MTQDAAHKNHGSYTSYLIGFVLAVVLTIIPFYIVMNFDPETARKTTVYLVVAICAILQIMVHLVFFLHMDRYFAKSYSGAAFWFTLFAFFAYVAGTIWLFYEVHFNMMPY